jgi:hypothetical protein
MLMTDGNYKSALRIAKDFKIGISKVQSNSLALAYECYVHPDFYTQIGKDVSSLITEGIAILKTVFEK